MKSRRLYSSCLTIAFALCSACSAERFFQSRYESMRRDAQNACRNQPVNTINDCLSRIDVRTYQDYEKECTADR